MGGKLTDDISLMPEQVLVLSESKIGIISAQWNEDICQRLLAGTIHLLEKYNIDFQSHQVPGSFELIQAASALCKTAHYDAIICLGCVIKGATDHDVYINHSIANNLGQLNIQYSTPVIFGVLTVNNMEQALERAGGKLGNKGIEAAITAIQMILFNKNIYKPNPHG